MGHVRTLISDRLGRLRRPTGPADEAESPAEEHGTAVERYWNRHTVKSHRFRTAKESEDYLEWRFAEYPLFREFTGLWGDHDGEVVLDYGCGPGNDVTGLAVHTDAKRVVGLDVSATALDLAARRLALHGVEEGRVELARVSDGVPSIPLDDDSVDHVVCLGVLHHTSDPTLILREFARVLRADGTASVMVYNRQSVWFHLYTAYERMLIEGAFPGLEVEEAFARNTDGPECPISRCYYAEDFLSLCREAGFDAEYLGGYLSRHELRCLERSWAPAIADARLGSEHRDFLRALTFDLKGYPLFQGSHAGIGGSYRLTRPAG